MHISSENDAGAEPTRENTKLMKNALETNCFGSLRSITFVRMLFIFICKTFLSSFDYNLYLQVGCTFIFSVLENYPDAASGLATLQASLAALLAAAQSAQVPILITLDGENWWESRSDLWNW